MAKFSNNNLSTIKIPLEQIREESGNVRKVYDWQEIENLAKSIQTNGLLNPLTVKPGVIEPGLGKNVYELICGHRRLRALALLQKQGVDVGLVECCIRTGDTWTLQMIENIQRTDLTAQDKENAIREMLEKGLSQKEIAELLSKPISYVSDIVAGTKVREQAEAAGVDTSSLKTRALAQLRSVNAEDLPGKVQELSEAGGTNAAATKILHDYKAETNDSEIEVPDFDEMIEPSSMSEADFYESEKEPKPTTHVSSDDLEEKYSVYGCFSIGKHWQQLELDGIYTIEEAKSRGRWLKKNLPTIDWLLYDELDKEELEID
ncbi:MAG: ParB/RepB/Spo0J family partition protein [Treponema succinifaciens]|uniref:ParB/RepB/Spo0J family partition protein n=1 Tax=Treponema succinifaciens TaxID=167 RepID=UPI002356D635|nr:ParB/RepB/Spo0J family partition protein [Treponema succinifaciens]MCI6912974.1 ParB/RepB/Spo0J family partition protein [Treponema succinifaciens]